ncbi:secreted Ly-6/uPAR domain-containing protein 2 isoform X3 [Labeo rohita]|uniref:secreted Ly-6/uPAR domain-containing protein 2 isoform X3 n=1 Tax=Labeo rohita TaxID=84645 RepID=UPI0021E259C9|nr:secreted Ly-6/uPAR domain-containing protein 2 isoform X3 [Labeo rohita]
MDLHISVVLLLIFLTGGHSLKCYTCKPDDIGSCDAKVKTCRKGLSKCAYATLEQPIGSNTLTATSKECASTCEPGVHHLPTGVTVTTHCCDTDLCNAADGVYKGSFLLLLSSLLFYFLFQ